MDAASRRQAILDRLRAADRPVSASSLAAEQNVSRQIIVGDIALLRSSGADTGGIHLHTLRCPDAAACERACAALKAAGLLLDD